MPSYFNKVSITAEWIVPQRFVGLFYTWKHMYSIALHSCAAKAAIHFLMLQSLHLW